MKDVNILYVLIIVLAIIGAISVVAYIVRKYFKDKKAAYEFLNNLKENMIYDMLANVIKNFDYDGQTSLVGIETNIIDEMKTSIKNLISNELNKNKTLTNGALKILSLAVIDSFADSIINSIDITKTIDSMNTNKYTEMMEKFKQEDESLAKAYEDDTLYNKDDKNIQLEEASNELLDTDKDGLEKRGFVLPNKEEEENLNPQVEEEEIYNEEDSSMELIDEEKYFVDNNGRIREKSTGRYAKKERS